MFIVVSYDIVDDKRRNRAAKILKDYGEKVQFSVFECILNEVILKEMKKRIAGVIETKEDSIRIYYLCDACQKKIVVEGVGRVSEDRDLYVV